jgi:chemotaxis protein MotB
MAEPGRNRPLVIKRKKVIQGGGHHGGAWKVAYADFVTAMMAFFLLLWLVNVTTEEQREGIAEYFAPAVPLSPTSGGGDGMFGGDKMSAPDNMLAGSGDVPAPPDADSGTPPDASAADRAAEAAALASLADALLGRSGESERMDELLQHVVTRLTDEGLIVEIFARPGAPIFDGAGAEPLPVLREIVGLTAELARMVTNDVGIDAHLPARSVLLARNPVWEVSSDRADAVRRLLEDGGLDAGRVHRLTGHADRSPLADDPSAPRNDRVEIIFLRRH